LLFYQDDFTASASDFSVVYNNADAELADYALLWMYLARIQAGANTVQSKEYGIS